jgi:hypothetical protein
MQTQFAGLMNRRDLTTALTQAFLQQSILRTQRTLRVPAMEKSITATVGSTFTGLTVPGDLLQFISMTDETNPGNVVELTRVALPEILRRNSFDAGSSTVMPVTMFARRASKFIVAPKPPAGSVLRMDYFATFKTLSVPTDSNVLSDVAPDAIIYGALSYAAAYFLDKRMKDFEDRYTQIVTDLQSQADRDELSGNAQVMPSSYFPSDF